MAAAVPIAMAAWQLYVTWQQTKAIKAASGLQVDASKEALAEAKYQFDVSQDFAEKQWNQTQAQMAPFIAAGQGGVSKLSHLLGVSGVSPNMGGTSGTSGTSTPGTPAPARRQRSDYEPPPATLPDRAGGKALEGVDLAPVIGREGQRDRSGRSGTDDIFGLDTARDRNPTRPQPQPTVGMPRGTIVGADGTVTPPSGDTVTMVAPDGTTQAVPAALADFYALRGARVKDNG